MCLPCAGPGPGEQQEPINTSAGVLQGLAVLGDVLCCQPSTGRVCVCAPQRIPSPLFVLEIWKACFVGLIECPEGTEELKWTAFTFLKVGPSPSTEFLPAAALSLQVWLLLSPYLCQSNQSFSLAVCPLGCPQPTVCLLRCLPTPQRVPHPQCAPQGAPWETLTPHTVLDAPTPQNVPLRVSHTPQCAPHNMPLGIHAT